MAVLSVTESQLVDAAGNLADVYEVSFTVGDRPGSFTITVPKGGDPIQAAADAIGATRAQVEAIYAL